jgi:hypothetical protein
MNRTIRSIRSTVGKALVLWAVALTFPVSPSVAVDHQESGGAEQQRQRHHDELTFTQIDVPGAALTRAQGLNDRGQIVGIYGDDVRRHGFLLSNGVFTDHRPGRVPGVDRARHR